MDFEESRFRTSFRLGILKTGRELFRRLDIIDKFVADIWIIGRYVLQSLRSCLSEYI